MRPVNLIPPEDRRGDAAPGRTGALPWIVVGALVLAVLGVGAVVFTNKDVSNKQAEVASLEQQDAALQARAESLAAFTNFQQIKDARVETVAALAESRFDWQRVMEELARVIPAHVWLVELNGSVAGGGEGAATGADPVPTLDMVGCARSQRAVARMISAVGDIDGITRVLVSNSEKSDASSSGGSGSTAGSGGGAEAGTDCRTRSYIPKFELTATFDEVAVPAGAVPPAPATDAEPTPATDDAAAGDEQVAQARETRANQAKDVAEADSKAEQAVDLASGDSG